MGAQQKKETFYFSHDYTARSDEKIKRLIRKHGMEGYGIYWAIIEDLYNNANALQTDYEGIAYDLRVDSDTIESIIKDFDLFEINDKTFGSHSVQRRLEDRNTRSKKASVSAQYRWNKKTEMRTHCERIKKECDSNAIKERKGKERKLNNILEAKASMSDDERPTQQDHINYQSIIDFFNSETNGVFGKILYPISDTRKASIRARIREHGQETFDEMIRRSAHSNFLKGENKTGWKATFDWMIRPNNFQKIIEGNYDNKNEQNNGRTGNDRQKGAHPGITDTELANAIRRGASRALKENATRE